jgi:pimeloyl-ACP methyl ester carboxylesterase
MVPHPREKETRSMLRKVRPFTLLIAAFAAGMLLGAPGASASKYVSIKGAPAPGPSVYDEVFVDKFGPKNAKNVLVLIPGTGGGTGSLAPVARDLSEGVKGLQVWTFDRREQAFEDTSGFASGDADTAAAYYLGFQYDKVTADQVPFVADWGFATEMNDLHQVIAKASKHGRKVILGGHSRGGSSVVSYAAWDFGKDGPGFKDLDGMVLIDGGLAAFGPSQFSLEDAQAGLAEIEAGDMFSDPLGAGIPEAGPIFAEVAALYAKTEPDAPSPLQSNPLIVGAGLSPPYAVTNEALLGYLFDKTYSPLGASLQIRAGDFGPGDPKTWADGENTPIEDFAGAFSREPGNATEWYYPNRMILDTSAANALGRTPAADFLGLRLFHTKQINIPLYAIQTELTNGGVLEGAHTLIDKSKITETKLVDASATMSHLDPVLAPAKTYRFTKTVEPFLRGITK